MVIGIPSLCHSSSSQEFRLGQEDCELATEEEEEEEVEGVVVVVVVEEEEEEEEERGRGKGNTTKGVVSEV